MNKDYSILVVFNFGKRSYTIMFDGIKIMFFENVDGKYVMPINSFNLYDNEGKSLTNVNQHFFVSQLVSRLNDALKKGYFTSSHDVQNYLSDLKLKIENDLNLKMLFKGSSITDINEESFEQNKKALLNYLDSFRFDTFVNYNNVSIFNGSLEKSESNIADSLKQDTKKDDDVSSQPIISSQVNKEPLILEDEHISSDVYFNTVKDNNDNELIHSVDNEETLSFDFVDDDNSSQVISDLSFNDSSNDLSNSFQKLYFNSNDDSSVNNLNSVNDNFKIIEDYNANINENSDNVINSESINSDNSIANGLNLDVSNLSYLDQVRNRIQNGKSLNSISMQLNSNDQVVQNVMEDKPSYDISNSLNNSEFDVINNNDVYNINGSNIVNESVNIDTSNISNEIANINNFKYNNEIASFDSNVKLSNVGVISDKTDFPELESIDDNSSLDQKGSKKISGKVIAFMLILVILLIVFAYYLYNYVF